MCTGYFICRTLYLMLDNEWGLAVLYAIITTIDIICDAVTLKKEEN